MKILTERERSRRPFLLVILLLVIYVLTAPMSGGVRQNVDTLAAAAPAQSLVTTGDLDVSQFTVDNPWFLEFETGLLSNRPIALSLVAVPFYLIGAPWLPADEVRLGPSSVAAAVVTALAVLVCFHLFRRLADERSALVGALVLGLGTSTWTISAAALWPHGPSQLMLALVMLGLAAGRPVAAAVGSAAALAIRPVTVAGSLALGTLETLRRRDWRPLITVLVPTVLAAAILVTANGVLFGDATLTPGYFTGVAGSVERLDAWLYGRRLLGALVDPLHGVLVLSPVVLVAGLGVPQVWRGAPGWVRSACLSGAVYLLAHLLFNRYNPGLGVNYRYPLEAITLASPMLFLAGLRWLERGRGARFVLAAAIAFSIAFQVAEATELTYAVVDDLPSWLRWQPV